MIKLVADVKRAVAAIRNLDSEVAKYPALAARLAQAHAYYVADDLTPTPSFGFSKIVGVQDANGPISGPTYVKNSKMLSGTDTERTLAQWFEEVRYGTPHYQTLFSSLTAWLGQYGKIPRQGSKQKLRLMVLKPQHRPKSMVSSASDQAWLDLLIAAAAKLPPQQRQQLRASL